LRGETVYLRVRNNGGTIVVDAVAVQPAKVPGWTIRSTKRSSRAPRS
jgi:hypothetical protein